MIATGLLRFAKASEQTRFKAKVAGQNGGRLESGSLERNDTR